MILSFSTQINGKPTYFMEKIWAGLEDFCETNNRCIDQFHKGLLQNGFDDSLTRNPKIHTIREDKNQHWKPGVMIDFFINARQENMFRFAPRVPVVSTQEIFMTRRGSLLEISIAKVGDYIGGDDFTLDAFQKAILCENDGFDEWEDFRKYFIQRIEDNGKATGNYWFKGKIIHWTNFRY